MTKREVIVENYPEEEFIFADGFDSAIIGVDNDQLRIVYSVEKMLVHLMVDRNMDYDEADNYLVREVYCNYTGEKTPIYVDDTMMEDADAVEENDEDSDESLFDSLIGAGKGEEETEDGKDNPEDY